MIAALPVRLNWKSRIGTFDQKVVVVAVDRLECLHKSRRPRHDDRFGFGVVAQSRRDPSLVWNTGNHRRP